MHARERQGTLLIMAVLLAGCDGRAWRSPEQRINDAIPPAAVVMQAKSRLGEVSGGDQRGAELFEAEFQTRLKLRALSCAQGAEPGFLESTQSIRTRLPPACFQKADEDLLAWLNQRRVRKLLAAAPLRAIPLAPSAVLTSSSDISTIRFAHDAGVALAASYDSIEVIDTGNDETLYSAAKIPNATAADISPNGRVIALGAPGEGVVLQDATSGESLAKYADHSRFMWLDSTSAVLQRKDGAGYDLLDFADGGLQRMKGQVSGMPLIVPSAQGPRQFVMSGNGLMSLFQLNRSDTGLRLAQIAQQPGPRSGWSETSTSVASDGLSLIQFVNQELWITNLKTLESEQVAIPSLRISAVMPLPDPGEVLLRAHMQDGTQSHFVYSLEGRSFAPVVDEALVNVQGYSSARLVRVPAADQVGIVSGRSVRLVSEIARGPRYGAQVLDLLLQEELTQRQAKRAAAEAQRLGYSSSGTLNGVPVMAGPIADAARNARVEAIGVYEPEGGSKGAGANSTSWKMPVQVFLRRSDKPIVLVLSSYEAVEWRLNLLGGAQLKAVLVSGYKDSTVSGAGNVRVTNMGRIYAYQRDSSEYENLQREVIRWTGQPIGIFQGKYRGASFTVGGN